MNRVNATSTVWVSVWRWAVFPVLVLVVFVTLVSLDLNGSSLAVFSTQPAADGLIEGTPRAIRSDEFLLQTPNAISSVAQGLPAQTWIGLSRVDQAVAAGGGPTLDWSTLFKPQNWGYVLLGASRGLSVYWWFPFAVSLGGCFALFGLLTRRPVLSAGIALVATFTPYAGWWTPSLLVGNATLAAATVLAAWLVTSKKWALVLSVAGGLIGATFALALYPPWQVSIAMVMAALAIGFALDRRVAWRRFFWTLGISIMISGSLAIIWVQQHRAAIDTVANTVYPGQRKTVAGTGSLETLLSAPLNAWMTGDAGATLGMNGRVGAYANLSESSSSWLPLPVLLLGMVGAVILLVRLLLSKHKLRRSGGRFLEVAGGTTRPAREPTWSMFMVSAVIVLLTAWTFLPLPNWVGAITLLQLVQPSRTSLALGFAAIILASLATTVHQRPRLWSWPWLLLAAVATSLISVWSAETLAWDSALVPMRWVLVSGLILGVLFAWLFATKRASGAAVTFGILAFASWALINPLQMGIAPLSNNALVVQLRGDAGGRTDQRALVFGDFTTVAKVRAAGFQSVSGTTPYPDPLLMNALAPNQEALWNNYAQYRWIPSAAGSSPVITRVNGSSMTMSIDPCDPIIASAVKPDWVISDEPLDVACLVLHTTVREANTDFFVYTVVPS